MIEILGAIAAALVAVIVAYVRGRSTGRDIERGRAAEQRADAMKSRKETDDAVDAMDRDGVRGEYDRWVRDDDAR